MILRSRASSSLLLLDYCTWKNKLLLGLNPWVLKCLSVAQSILLNNKGKTAKVKAFLWGREQDAGTKWGIVKTNLFVILQTNKKLCDGQSKAKM